MTDGEQSLTRKQAIDFLALDEKTFDNFFKSAGEFDALPRPNNRGRFFFEKKELENWLNEYRWRTIELNFDEYILCLDFALAQHFRGYVLSDWGTARQREFGQKITNWVKGQLAEVAVKKFLQKEFNVEVELDFSIYDEIVPQDIVAVRKGGKPREPRLGVGIKSSKPKSAYLILSENEIVREKRRSDIYIFCRPNIPDDHLLRLTHDRIKSVVKKQQHFSAYKNDIPRFENMHCEIAGWCKLEELVKVNKIPGLEFNGNRFVKKSGDLHRDKKSWKKLIKKL